MAAGDREQGQGADDAPTRLGRATASDRSLLARSSLTLLSRSFAKSVQILFLIVAARLLTVEEFATYSYMLVLAFVFATVSDTGVPIVASRDISAGRALPGDIYAAAMPVVLVAAVLAALFLPLVAVVDSGPGSTITAGVLIAAFVVFNRLFEFQATTLRGVGQFGAEAAIQAGGAALFISAATAVTAAGLGVIAVLAMLCAKELASAAAAYLVLRPDLKRSTGPSGVGWRELLRLGIRLSIAGIALVLVMRLPLVVLGNSGSPRGRGDLLRRPAVRRRRVRACHGLGHGSAPWNRLPGALGSGAGKRPSSGASCWRPPLPARWWRWQGLPLAEPAMRIIFGSEFAAGEEPLQIILLGLPGYVVLGICWYTIVAFHGETRLLGGGTRRAGLAAAAAALISGPRGGERGGVWSYVISLYPDGGPHPGRPRPPTGRSRPPPCRRQGRALVRGSPRGWLPADALTPA